MVDTFTNNFNLVLQATGSNGGTWGTDWNNNGTTPIDQILGGTQAIVMSGANVTLTLAQWQNGAFKITGTLTASVQLILPLSPNSVGGTPGVGGKFIVDNQTTGNFTVTVLTAATGSTGVVAPQGFRTLLYSDTVNVFYVSPIGPASLTTLQVSGAAVFANTVSMTGTSVTIGTGKLSLTSTDSMAMANGTTAQRNVSPSQGDTRYNNTLHCLEYWNGTLWVTLGQEPTVQRFTSGTGTYTPTSTSVLWVRGKMCASGGGGGGIAGAGSNGNDSSFGTWTAIHGAGAPAVGNSLAIPAGGTGGVNGTGILVNRFKGGDGGPSTANLGGMGGANPFGGAGAGSGDIGSQGGSNGAPNTGSGGGGTGNHGGADGAPGGAAGEYVEFIMTAAQASGLAYSIGASAAGGAQSIGQYGGGASGSGYLVIEEYYT